MLLNIENLTDKFIQFEEGEMSESEVVSFFQELVNTGLVGTCKAFMAELPCI